MRSGKSNAEEKVHHELELTNDDGGKRRIEDETEKGMVVYAGNVIDCL